MIKFQSPKGTQDILPEEIKIWQKIETIARKICDYHNFSEIRTPTFENENLFNRSIGSATDVVEKEMFTFCDLAGRKLALRPEGTASVVRAILQHGLINQPMPLKLFYLISCFRNERPQSGRFKEFHQFGLEMFGSLSPIADVELIMLVDHFFSELNIKNLNLEINSIGCENCRPQYRTKLIKFFKTKETLLCPICVARLQKNPLRILDCKTPSCINIAKEAPQTTQNLCSSCELHFNQICDILTHENISFHINPSIVRGLDYYTRTVFEFQSNTLGAQNTVCGGGRYDKLVETLSNHCVPALGCAIGLERLIIMLQEKNDEKIKNEEKSCCLFIGNFETTIQKSANIVFKLRKMGLNAETNVLNRSVKAQMKYANKINAQFSCILGDEELSNNKVTIKHMTSKQTFEISLSQFIDDFLKIWTENKHLNH